VRDMHQDYAAHYPQHRCSHQFYRKTETYEHFFRQAWVRGVWIMLAVWGAQKRLQCRGVWRV